MGQISGIEVPKVFLAPGSWHTSPSFSTSRKGLWKIYFEVKCAVHKAFLPKLRNLKLFS